MPRKYFAGIPEAVTLVGSVHGALFVALVAMFVVGMKRIPIPPRLTAMGIVAAVLPFGPFVVDRRLGGPSSPLKNRRAGENEDFGVRARRETGGKVVTFVEDFATQP